MKSIIDGDKCIEKRDLKKVVNQKKGMKPKETFLG